MKQYVILCLFVSVLVGAALFGITTPTFAQVECHQIKNLSATPFGWAPPIDILTGTSYLMLQLTCNDTSIDVEFGTGNVHQRISDIGYLYTEQGWQQFTYTGTYVAPGWLASPATARIPISPGVISRGGYVVGHACDWVNNEWKCGCRDFFCETESWQIQSFQSFIPAVTSQFSSLNGFSNNFSGSSGSTLTQ